MDLFEHYETLPQEVNAVIEKYCLESMTYKKCDLLIKKLNEVGYTCDYGLDACPYSLRRNFVVGERFTYSEITSIIKDEEPDDTDFICTEEGEYEEGKFRVILKHKRIDERAEFLLLGVHAGETIFECTFTNL